MEENVVYLLKVLEVALIASVKFLIAPFESERYGFNLRESFIITTVGGFVGILLFTFLGDVLAFSFKKFRMKFQKSKKKTKKFTWSTRFFIKTKKRFGLLGVSLITPSIISIPVGTFLIHRLYKGKIKNILVLVLALLIWSTLLNLLAQYLKLSQYLHLPN